MPNTIMKNSETTYTEILQQAGQRIQRTRHFDRTTNRITLGLPDNDIVATVQNLCEKFRSQQRIIRQQSEFLDIYRDKLVSSQQNLDNCTENARTTNPMPLTEGTEDMNRRQKLRINGQERWISFSSTQELIDLVQAEFNKQKQGEESPATVSDYMLNWFETYKRPKLDPNTAKGDISKINKHILPAMGSKRINDVTVADVQKIMSNLQSASTAKQVKSIINQCFEAAIADELYTHPNPAADKRIVMPTKVTKRSPLGKDDLAILLETLPKMKPDHACLLVILIMTGCRRSEALGVRWEDIDWEKKTIHLQRVIRFRNNQPEVSDKMKTKSANRMVDYLPAIKQEKKAKEIIAPKLVSLYLYTSELLAMIEYSAKKQALFCIENMDDMDKLSINSEEVMCKQKSYKNESETGTAAYSYSLLKNGDLFRTLVLNTCSEIASTPSFSFCDPQVIHLISEIQLSELLRMWPKPDDPLVQFNAEHLGLGKGFLHLKTIVEHLALFVDPRLGCEMIDISPEEVEKWQRDQVDTLKQYPEIAEMLVALLTKNK